jgi:GNAT superfamily N-acetyltransferase
MVKDQIAIRPAMLGDSEACAALLGELGYPATSAFVHEKLKQLADGEGDRVFVALVDGKVVGLASCHIMPLMHEPENLCRVTALVVAADFRCRKIGGRLLQEIEKYAQDSGCVRIEVTSGEQRQDAHTFYEELGFHEVSRRFIKRLGHHDS